MNKTLEDEAKKERLVRASYLTRKESIKVNAEFEAIRYDFEG